MAKGLKLMRATRGGKLWRAMIANVFKGLGTLKKKYTTFLILDNFDKSCLIPYLVSYTKYDN